MMTRAQAIYTLSAPDYTLMGRLNGWRAPRWVRRWMLLATRAGDGWLWGLVGIRPLRHFRRSALPGARSCGQRGRRGHSDLSQGEAHLLPHCWAHIVTRDEFSFPSGHSTTAFAVAVSLGSFYPEIMPLLLLLAANVAVSRVVVGMHFLSDVNVGSGTGALLGYAAFRFAA
jgi:undecaprenyl-diphosphatase